MRTVEDIIRYLRVPPQWGVKRIAVDIDIANEAADMLENNAAAIRRARDEVYAECAGICDAQADEDRKVNADMGLKAMAIFTSMHLAKAIRHTAIEDAGREQG